MRIANLAVLLLCLTATAAPAATVSAEGKNYLVRSFFTSALEDTLPVDRIDMVHPGQQVVIYTTYANLSAGEHTHTGKLFDAHGTLVQTIDHTFEPCSGKQRAWQWFVPASDAPGGMWRFEAWLDGKKLLTNSIFVGVQ